MSNSTTITVHANAQCTITSSSNAAFDQYLTVTDGSTSYQFSGAGENRSMTVTKGGSGPNANSVTMDPQEADRDITLQFQYLGSNGFTPSVVNPAVVTVIPLGQNGTLTRYVIGTEDGSDNDNNDTIAVIECILLNK